MNESRLEVSLGSRSYPILCTPELPGNTLVVELERLTASMPRRPRLMVLSDTEVAPLYAGAIVEALEGQGYRTVVHVVESGERSKDWAVVGAVIDHALEFGFSRDDILIALGGGVVGDLCGFVASILHRGVRFIQVPTTLLSQVDSAVGGKTAINHSLGKNLVGTFWQPSAVISSQQTLRTLPVREIRGGLAEAIKHGFILDESMVEWMLAHRDNLLERDEMSIGQLVARCCALKASVVCADERDRGHRAALNFGHTFGHAYERLCGYGELSHGEAVALGMVWAARLSVATKTARGDLEAVVQSALRTLELPWDIDDKSLPSVKALIDAAKSDKKSNGTEVRFVLLRKVGDFVIEPLPWTMITQLLSV